MARSRSGSGAKAVLVVGGLAAAISIGLAVAKSKSAQAATSPQVPPAPAPAPAPSPIPIPGVTPPSSGTVIPTIPVPAPTTALLAGHRYSLAQLAPIPGAPIATAAQAQTFFDALMPNAVRVVAITPATGSTPTTMVVDALINLPFIVPPGMTLTDISPPTSGLLTPITDVGTVKQYQTIMAAHLATLPPGADQFGITATDYTPADVDGNPANARWKAVLAKIQQALNPELAKALASGTSNLPAGFPPQLRTDGVLDYATAVLMVNA